MPTVLQGTQNFNRSYVSGALTKAFSKNVTAGSLLAVAVWWLQAETFATGVANISVSDNKNGSHATAFFQTENTPSFFAKLQVTYVLSAAAGATTISVSADQPGILMFAVSEVAPDAGLVWVSNGAAWGHANAGDSSLTVGAPSVEGSYNSNNNYSFLAWGNGSGTFLGDITSGLWTNRQFVQNNTSFDTGSTFKWYGTLGTWDALNQGTGGGVEIFGSGVDVYAVCAQFSLIVPSCDAPTASPTRGTYTGPQTVTLSQDQGKPMFYTLDGTTPTTSSTSYSGAISISNSSQLKVLAHDSSMTLADTVTLQLFNHSLSASEFEHPHHLAATHAHRRGMARRNRHRASQ